MNVSYRRTTPDDFPACLAMTREAFALDARQRAGLPALWRYILENGLGEAATVEEHSEGRNGSERRLLAFGLSAFVSDSFVAELRGGGLPFLATHLLARWQVGESPLLTPADIGWANRRDGLNLLVLNSGHNPQMPEGSALYHAAQRTSIGAMFAMHAGWQIKEMLAEFCGEKVIADALVGGLQLRSDHTEFYARSGIAPPPSNRRPYLAGLTRREALDSPGLGFATVFVYSEPRLDFTPAERRLLLLALEGETDDEAAHSLALSSATVKKRWQAIYERVDRLAPHVLPLGGEAVAEGRRGTERRRHLLNYLRGHLEELRPTGRL